MKQIGRKIYYEKTTGNILVDTGERQGVVVETTVQQDFESYSILNERTPETVGVIELAYGELAQDFTESNGVSVNPTTKTLEFSYPDPNEPEAEQPYQVPLSESINANTDYLLDVDFRLIMVELGIY